MLIRDTDPRVFSGTLLHEDCRFGKRCVFQHIETGLLAVSLECI